MHERYSLKKQNAFTIVELLIAILVIAILAVIVTVVYNGITKRAIESTLKQDIANGNRQIEVHRATTGSLPSANSCPSPGSDEICLEGSEGTTFTYQPNSNIPPTSYQLLASNGESRFVSNNGASVTEAYGSQFVTLTNMALNGDFSAGGANWSTTYCYGSSICQFDGNVLNMISDATNRIQVAQSFPGPYSDGDVIFYSARIQRVSGTGVSMQVYRTGGGFIKWIMTAAQFNEASLGEFIRYSDNRTFVASQGPTTFLQIGYHSTRELYEINVDDAVVVNLTAAFGAGNEPTPAEMEDILSQFENGYFAGTVSATY